MSRPGQQEPTCHQRRPPLRRGKQKKKGRQHGLVPSASVFQKNLKCLPGHIHGRGADLKGESRSKGKFSADPPFFGRIKRACNNCKGSEDRSSSRDQQILCVVILKGAVAIHLFSRPVASPLPPSPATTTTSYPSL